MNRFTERRCSQAWHFYGASFRRFAPAEMGDPPQARPLRLSVGSDWPWLEQGGWGVPGTSRATDHVGEKEDCYR